MGGGAQPQHGVRGDRSCRGKIDLGEGGNVKWTAYLGSDGYGTPSIADGKVLIGANNARPRDPRHQGDRGVLLCLDEDGRRVLLAAGGAADPGDRFKDWPRVGMCSPPTVEGDRVYTMTNRFEVVCLDLNGQADGNDGPYKDEGRHMSPAGEHRGGGDRDRRRHHLAVRHAEGRRHLPARLGPRLGADRWRTALRQYQQRHGQHPQEDPLPGRAEPDRARQEVGAAGRQGPGGHRPADLPLDLVAAGARRGRRAAAGLLLRWRRGVLRLRRPRPGEPARDSGRRSTARWRFDCDPAAPKENVSDYMGNRDESPSNIKSMPVFHDGRVYVTATAATSGGARTSRG